MKRTIQARIYKGDTHYVAECTDLPIVTQGKTLDEVTANLREAITLHLEGEDFSEFDVAREPVILASYELGVLTHAET
jgi:predicted RNase H-like HicB family nuclease